MSEIKFEYLYINEPYRFNSNLFDTENIITYTKFLQNRYKDFADKINKENGYIQVNLSFSTNLKDGIYYECLVLGISKELNAEIEAAIPSR